jgi:hypothetical protein
VRARAALAALVVGLLSAAMIGEAKALALKSGATSEDSHPFVSLPLAMIIASPLIIRVASAADIERRKLIGVVAASQLRD